MPALSARILRPSAPARPRPWRSWAAAVLLWLSRCAHRHRSRADLRDLDPRLLRDIGLTEGAALREIRKPWWYP